MQAKAQQIAHLNDVLRQTLAGGRCVVTSGVAASPHMAEVLEAVRQYSFSGVDGNNPYGENDFGAVEIAGQKYFWKIDYYDLDLQFHSPDPTDPSVTRRVLTVMLANEY